MNTMSLMVRTNSTQEIGLEALFVGSIYKKMIGTIERPDCGQIEIKTIGVDVYEEIDHLYVSCNDLFVDLTGKDIRVRSLSGNPKYVTLKSMTKVDLS